jgi:hypothetical protein
MVEERMTVGFVGTGKEAYVYLNGIRPREEVILGDGVVFLPGSCQPNPDDIIAKSKSEIDIGVACIFLRSVSAYFRVTANTPQAVAARAWNSQWDAVLLSALYDCEVGYTFQSDVPPERFAKAKVFFVSNYAFKGLNAGKVRQITPAEHRWIAAHYSAAKRLMDDDRYCDAVHSLSSYRWHCMPRAQIALLWSGIEGLFGVDSELSFRLSLYIARYLSPRKGARQNAIFDSIKKLYGIRSKAVHGGKIRNAHEFADESVKILRQLVVKCAELGELPNTDCLAP